jgi:hypothetical protein
LTDEKQTEAEELAHRAASQAKNAAKNSGRAAKAVAEPVVETVVDEARDTAQKFENTAGDVARVARRVNPKILSRMSSDTGVAFLALSASLYAGAVAFNKFRVAYAGRKQVLS